MRGKKVEVSAAEMMEMRREGLSNADIAELLEISVQTVRNYIGNQGRHMERLAVFADKGKKKQPEEEEEIRETKKQMKKPKYEPSQEVYRIGYMTVWIERDARMIEIQNEDGAVRIGFDEAAELLEFLAWAGREKCQTEVDDAADDND